MSHIDLGDRVRDKITGYTGIATSRCMYLNGCNHIGIQAPVKADGTVPKIEWVDEPQVEIVEKLIPTVSGGETKASRAWESKHKYSLSGGPADHPETQRHPDPNADAYIEQDESNDHPR